MKTWNHYICEDCGAITVAKHENEGVTPFMIKCRATKNCSGLAKSTFFEGSQDNSQRAHVVFYRPEKREAAQIIAQIEDENERTWMLYHYNKGGALMRETSI